MVLVTDHHAVLGTKVRACLHFVNQPGGYLCTAVALGFGRAIEYAHMGHAHLGGGNHPVLDQLPFPFSLLRIRQGKVVSDTGAGQAQAQAKGRLLDDDGSALLRFDNGACGVLWASQICVGVENGLNIRVYGEKGGLEWQQQEPNTLVVRWVGKPLEIRRTGTAFVGKAAQAASRVPAGHPEGYQEAFANLYKHFADALAKVLDGKKVKETDMDYPTVHDGVQGMAFLDAVVRSSKAKQKWVKV